MGWVIGGAIAMFVVKAATGAEPVAHWVFIVEAILLFAFSAFWMLQTLQYAEDGARTEEPSGLVAQVAAEMRHRERDPAALAGVDQPLLEQRVAGRGQRLGLPAEHAGHVGGGDRAHGVGGSASRPAASAIARR